MRRSTSTLAVGILVAGCDKPANTPSNTSKPAAEPVAPAESPKPAPAGPMPIDTLTQKYDPKTPVPAQQLVSEYERDPQAASKKYGVGVGSSLIVVEGRVGELDQWESGAMQGVTVVFATKGKLSVHARMGRNEKIDLKPGATVRIEGILQGTGLWSGDENKILLASGKLLKQE